MPGLTLTEFADKIEEIMPVVMKSFAKIQAAELFKGKITIAQFFILNYLGKNGETMMKELAQTMSATTAAATGMVERLVREGYCERVYDSKDRRVIYVKLTAKGSGLVKRITQDRKRITVEIFGKISEEERRNYLSILTHIRDVLVEENNN